MSEFTYYREDRLGRDGVWRMGSEAGPEAWGDGDWGPAHLSQETWLTWEQISEQEAMKLTERSRPVRR